jgi:LysR family transcriptional regulator, hypochlorite-specific transcription factor HypT
MTMNLSWLEDFQALAESGHFSRAAESRHMTQPAFSRRIRALEDWLGTPLFDRSGHPVTLTEAGQWFRGSARQLLERAARLPEEARAVADGSAATLRFAATHALSLSFLPGWLRGLEARVAVGAVELISDVAARCETLLQQGRVQFLLCHGHDAVPARLDAAEFEFVEVGADRLLPVSAPDARGRPQHKLPAPGSRSGRVPLLAYGAESGLGRAVRALHGVALGGAEVVVTAHLATVLRSLALEGRGLAFLPASLMAADLEAGRLVPAGGAGWEIALSLRLYRRRGGLSDRAEAFWAAAHPTLAAPARGPSTGA